MLMVRGKRQGKYFLKTEMYRACTAEGIIMKETRSDERIVPKRERITTPDQIRRNK